jgi:hypothetical protein
MQQRRFQTTLPGILVAMFWLALWLGSWRLLYAARGDGIVVAKLVGSFWIVIGVGFVSALRGQPTGRPIKIAIVIWLIFAPLIFLFTPAFR